MPDRVDRKLAAILAADVEGYSRLMGADEVATLRTLSAYRGITDALIAQYRGRVFGAAGDSVVAEFGSVVDAVQCAIEVQKALEQENGGKPPKEQMRFRIGVHVGDVIVQGSNLFGEGVNITARLESLAEPGGICVSGQVRDYLGKKLPVTFTDCGDQTVKNIAEPVRAYRLGASVQDRAAAAKTALALPDKPSIAVLPFTNMSGDPEQEYFADGMVEEIITALSRIRWLFVIARNSTFTYKGRAVDVKQIGRELGVRYVLEGSVRKAGNRMRITGQLIDAISGAHLWADHFDGMIQDVFELQDKVALAVAGVIEPALESAELQRNVARPTTDLTAYELYLRALADAYAWEKERVLHAFELLGQAIERDPQYGPALGLAANCHAALHVNGWTSDPEANRRRGVTLARQALQASRDDPDVLANAGYVLANFGEDINAAIALVDRALELNPSYARGWVRSGWLRLWSGQPEIAIQRFETAIRLSPRERRAAPLLGIGVGHFFARRLEEAKATLLLSLQEIPTWAPTHRFLASCYAHMGELDEARKVIGRLRNITSVVIPSADHWRNPEHREFYLEGLRMAAGECGGALHTKTGAS